MCSTSNTATENKASLPSLSRRRKRDKEGCYVLSGTPMRSCITTKRPKAQSNSKRKHGKDGPSGGVEALIPSLIGLCILGGALMAKMGFRGRATVAGIDLGTTNSVICVQAPSKGGTWKTVSLLCIVRCEAIIDNKLCFLNLSGCD